MPAFLDAPWSLPALLGAFLLVAGLTYGTRAPETPAPAAHPHAAHASAPAAAPAPSKDNVSPAIHGRLVAMRQQVALAPEDTAKLASLARLLHDAHRYDEAADTYRRLLDAAPEHRQAWLDLAATYAAAERWADARAAMEALAAQRPDDAAARYNLGAIAANEGDFAAARNAWRTVADQRVDADLAAQAAASLSRLDALEAGPKPGPVAAGQPLPPGHPPTGADPHADHDHAAHVAARAAGPMPVSAVPVRLQ